MVIYKSIVLCAIVLLGCDAASRLDGHALVESGRVNRHALEAAGLPETEVIVGSYPHETFRVDYTRSLSRHVLQTDAGVFQAIVHPAEGEVIKSGPMGGGRPPRVIGHGLPLVYGYGPVTVWRGHELWTRASTSTQWCLLDTKHPYGPVLIILHDNIGAEGWLEVYVLGKWPDSSRALGVVLDMEAKGYTYVLCASEEADNEAFVLEIYECLDGDRTRRGTLTQDTVSGEIVFRPR